LKLRRGLNLKSERIECEISEWIEFENSERIEFEIYEKIEFEKIEFLRGFFERIEFLRGLKFKILGIELISETIEFKFI